MGSQMQHKREKIRHLYDEIDELEGSLAKAGDKKEQAKIKKRLLVLRQEVARLLEPEGQLQVSLRGTEDGCVTPNVDSSPSSSPLGKGRVIARGVSDPDSSRIEEQAASQEGTKSRKITPPKPPPQKIESPKERIKKLERQIRTIKSQVLAEAAKYRRAVRSGAPASKTVLDDLLRKEQRLERERREAQRASQKGRPKNNKRAGQRRTTTRHSNIVTPKKIRKETKEEIKSR